MTVQDRGYLENTIGDLKARKFFVGKHQHT
jgi:hypothetical protein